LGWRLRLFNSGSKPSPAKPEPKDVSVWAGLGNPKSRNPKQIQKHGISKMGKTGIGISPQHANNFGHCHPNSYFLVFVPIYLDHEDEEE
jgi:hypothetical protein